MSISSCPRCSQQVTLPVGLANSAQVRCPLCRATFTLADALVNMPPLLEVVEDSQDTQPDWFDMPAESAPSATRETITLPVKPADDSLESDSEELAFDFDEPVASESREITTPQDDDLRFDAVDLEDDAAVSELDDLSPQETDTEVEELSLAAAEPVFDEVKPAATAHNDDDMLDFGEPLAFDDPADNAADEEIDFGTAEPLGDLNSAESLGDLDSAGDPNATIEFSAPLAASADDEEPLIDFNLDEEAAEFKPGVPPHFNQIAASEAPSDEDAIGLDFGEALPEATPVVPVAAVAADDKKKKKKDKKEKKEKAPKAAGDKPARKRSLVGLMLNIVLPGLLAIPLALYAAIWISPELDLLRYGRWMPGFMLPASVKAANKPKVAQAPATPYLNPADLKGMAAGFRPDAGGAPPADAPPAETPAADPAADGAAPPADGTAIPAPDAPAADAPPAAAPADPTPTDPPQSGTVKTDPNPPAATPPAEDIADAGTPAPAEPAAPAEETPAPPAAAATPSDDLPSEPAATPPAGETEDLDALLGGDDKKPAEEMPDEPATDDAADAPSLGDPADDAAMPDEAMPEAVEEEAEELGPRTPREYTAADVTKAMKAAETATAKMNASQNADETAAKKIRKDFFLSLYGLADAITFARDEEGAAFDAEKLQAGEKLQEYMADPKRREALKKYAAQWFTFPKRTTPGIVLAGTVQEVQKAGKLYLAKVKLGSGAGAPTVTLVSADEPDVAPADEVFALGSIIDQPADELAGYEGDASPVVWSSITEKLTAH